MELLEPIFVKRWVSENKYIEYIFDINGNYDDNAIKINKYIFRDINIKETLEKIAHNIINYEKKKGNNISNRFYCWTSEKNVEKSLLFNIEAILWNGYHVNPFKSYDRDSQQLKDPIVYKYIDDILRINKINIVFDNDFKYDIKYYFPDNKKIITKINTNIEDYNILLYNFKIDKTKLQKDEYFNISFTHKYEIDSLIVLFDNFKTTDNMQLIQLINNNNAIYKLYKNHKIDDKDLSKIFNLINKDNDLSINIYYKNENIKLTINNNGEFTISINYHMDKGVSISIINNIKLDIIEYLKEYFHVNIDDFKATNINSRITYSVDYINTSFIKKIGLIANIYQDYEKNSKDNEKKNSGYYIYKRTNDIDIDTYIRNRTNYRKIASDEIFKELKDRGFNQTLDYINKIVKNIDDMKNYKLNKNNTIEDNSTINVTVNNDNIEIIAYNFKSFFELNNFKYWMIRTIELLKDKKPSKKKYSPIKVKSPIVNKKSSSSSSSSSVKSDKSDKSSEDYNISSDEIEVVGGGKNKEHYLINKLKIADKELWNGDNPPRRCQRPKQPIVLTEDELNELKKNGHDKILDNIIKHGSNINNLNYYTCPKIWCPISNIPLDENNPTKELKCPDENEEPIMMNEIMKNAKNKRFAYIINKHNLPCCGNKDPELKSTLKKKSNSIQKINDIAEPKEKRGRKKKQIVPLIEIKDNDASFENDKKSNENSHISNNYIMTQIPVIYKNRYGNIRKELYYILYDDYKDYLTNCINRNNINKHNCLLRKGLKDISVNIKLNNYDNIIDVVAFLLNKTRINLLKDIEKKLDIITFISLENGNVYKDFSDNEPVIPEFNKELYSEFLNKFNNELLSFPKIEDNSKKSLYKKSRILYIYKAYIKFINYLKSSDSKYDKNIQYIYSLIAILYKRLILSWEIEKGIDNGIQLICPYYTKFNELIPFLDKNPKMIMIYKDNNNDTDNIINSIYEPIVSKSINTNADIKHYNLDNHKNINEILNRCGANIKDNNIDLYINKENIRAIIRRVNNIENNSIEIYNFKTLIINRDLSIDKIILENNVIINFKKQSIIIINALIEFFKIKNVVFIDDIIGHEYIIKIKNDVHAEFEKDANLLGINIEKFEIIKETKHNTKGKIIFKDYELDDNILLNSDYFNKYHKYIEKNKENTEKMYDMRKYIRDILLSDKFSNEYYINLSKHSRKDIIEILLKYITKDNKYNSRDIQVILEEINVSSIDSIKDWYSLSLANFKYDYTGDISENIIETDRELIFSQYLVSNNNIPKKIMSYKDYYPNNINNIQNPIESIYEFLPDLNNKSISNIPLIFKGIENELNSKWKKYTKKIWSKLRYIKINYTENYIKDLYEFLINYDNNIITNIHTFNNIIKYTYIEYENILCNNLDFSNIKRRNEKLIEQLFKDPHFYNVYVKSMNTINNSNKTFKTLRLFFETYFNNSSIEERRIIIQYIKNENKIKFFGDIMLKIISKWLNINIFIIYERLDYGKGIAIDKRAGNKDLNLTSVFYKAENNSIDILNRPLIMLYRQKNKTNNISYYLIKVRDNNIYIYNELENAPEEIKIKLVNLKYNSNDSIQSISK